MTLETHVRADLLKLRKRLTALDISDVTEMEYGTYLRSTLWKKIKAWIHARDRDSCQICMHVKTRPRAELDVHHHAYDLATLEGRDDKQLVTLCRRCHDKVEHFANGQRRTSLTDKKTEYQRLVGLHLSIDKNGMPLQIRSVNRSGGQSHAITYHGPPDYCEFYSLDSLMFRFALSFISNRDKFRVPLPFGPDKLRQPSGASVIDVKTNKKLITVTCADAGAMVKVSRACIFPVKQHLMKVIAEAKPWRTDN